LAYALGSVKVESVSRVSRLFQLIAAETIEDARKLNIPQTLVDAIQIAIERPTPELFFDFRLVIGEELRTLYGDSLFSGFETGYMIGVLSGYCGVIARAPARSRKRESSSIEKHLFNLERVAAECLVEPFPGLCEEAIPRWRGLLQALPFDLNVFAKIEKESFEMIESFLSAQNVRGFLRKSRG